MDRGRRQAQGQEGSCGNSVVTLVCAKKKDVPHPRFVSLYHLYHGSSRCHCYWRGECRSDGRLLVRALYQVPPSPKVDDAPYSAHQFHCLVLWHGRLARVFDEPS